MEDAHVLVLHFTPKNKSFVSQKFGGSTSESSGLRLIGLFQYIHKFALMYWTRRKCPLLLTGGVNILSTLNWIGMTLKIHSITTWRWPARGSWEERFKCLRIGDLFCVAIQTVAEMNKMVNTLVNVSWIRTDKIKCLGIFQSLEATTVLYVHENPVYRCIF